MNPKFPVLTACTLVLSQLLMDVAGAQTATNVNCSSCISNGEIANNAVTSEKIVNGSVTLNDLAAGSVKAATIDNGSVTSAKLAPSVRRALNDALANLTTVAVEDATVGIAEAACPSGRIPVSASCLCDDNNGNNNLRRAVCLRRGRQRRDRRLLRRGGNLQPDQGQPSGDRPGRLPRRRVVRRHAVGSDVGRACARLGLIRSECRADTAQAQWHKEQHEAFQSKVAELRARRARHRNLLLD